MPIIIRRRDFITLLGGAAAWPVAATWPLAARAQQRERMRRIGVLMSVENDPDGKAQLSGFTQGLAEIGWTDGHNLRMEVRWGGGDVNRIRTFAKELVALRDPCARNPGDCGTPTGDADDPDRICDCY
jgi:putative tryptophan/tyrosine transport system substrate-binding protein